jgi:hypothetical protein
MDKYRIVWGVVDGEYVIIRVYDETDLQVGGPLKIPSNSTRTEAEVKVIDLDWAPVNTFFVHEGNCPDNLAQLLYDPKSSKQ